MGEARKSRRRADVVVLTAIPLEYEAVLEVEAGAWPGTRWQPDEQSPNHLPASRRAFRGQNGQRLEVVVAQAVDMGPVRATQALGELVATYRPRCLAMCGVCAGRPGKTQLGDVIAADRLFFHDIGKQRTKDVQQDLTTYNLRDDWKTAIEREGFAQRFLGEEWCRGRPWPLEWQKYWLLAKLQEGIQAPADLPEADVACARWKEVVLSLRRDGHMKKGKMKITAKGRRFLQARLELHRGKFPDLSPRGKEIPFRVHVSPMGSGSKVIADRRVWGHVSSYMRKILGLEMEAAAVAAFAQSRRTGNAPPIDAIVMKGVMDFASAGKNDHFKGFAARASAECLLAFLREHLEPTVVPGQDDLLVSGTGTLGDDKPPPPSALLAARHEVVDFEDPARADILAELDRWADAERAVAVRLIHAEGGAGKTRLGIEWTRRRREEGWHAGFLRPDPPEDWLERLWDVGRPVAVVLDYAESRPGLAKTLERALAYREQAGTGALRRMRFLLLARNRGDWWEALRQGQAALRDWLDDTPPHELRPLAGGVPEREDVLRRAVEAFAGVLKKPIDGRPLPAVTDPLYDRALYLHMAALAFVEGRSPAPGELMDHVLKHEERFWGPFPADGSESSHRQGLARQMVAAATLRGGLADREHGRALLGQLVGREPSEGEQAMLGRLHRVYERPGSGVYLPPLEPDPLGEAMVLRVTAPPLVNEQGVAEEWIDRVFRPGDPPHVVQRGLEVLARSDMARPGVLRPWMARMLTGAPVAERALPALVAAKSVGKLTAFSSLGDLLAECLQAAGDASLAAALERVGLPESSVSLRRVAEWIFRVQLAAAPTSDSDEVLATRARLLNNLGKRLSEVGRREEALEAAREAVEKYRELAKRNEDAFLPYLATSLNNLGAMLSKVGRREEALAAVTEAGDTLWPFFERHPPAFASHAGKILLQTLRLHEEMKQPPPPALVERMAAFARLTKS